MDGEKLEIPEEDEITLIIFANSENSPPNIVRFGFKSCGF
jgi:hypothetical protein